MVSRLIVDTVINEMSVYYACGGIRSCHIVHVCEGLNCFLTVTRRRLVAKSLPASVNIDKLPYMNYDYSYVSLILYKVCLAHKLL